MIDLEREKTCHRIRPLLTIRAILWSLPARRWQVKSPATAKRLLSKRASQSTSSGYPLGKKGETTTEAKSQEKPREVSSTHRNTYRQQTEGTRLSGSRGRHTKGRRPDNLSGGGGERRKRKFRSVTRPVKPISLHSTSAGKRRLAFICRGSRSAANVNFLRGSNEKDGTRRGFWREKTSAPRGFCFLGASPSLGGAEGR